MKTKSLATMAKDVAIEREASAAASPKISLKKALAARFCWQGQDYTVGTCELAILRQFLEYNSVSLHAKKRTQYEEAMSCLDASYGDIGRWQAIDSLLVYGVLLPLR